MRPLRWTLAIAIPVVGLSLAGAWAQPGPPAEAVLSVAGDVPKARQWTAGELAKLPRQTLKAKDHAGKESEFEGVPLVALLKEAGLAFGQDLRGPALARYLVVEASDGYRVVFALPELDPAFTDEIILLADRRDGRPMVAPEGPFRIVAPGDKRHARWVRQVIALRVGRG